MGGFLSSGKNNAELVDKLIDRGDIRSKRVELVFRCVDRGFYFTPDECQEAYKDSAWQSGYLHQSAPGIYAKVLEELDLKEGCSFLNVGSGTGYFSTLAGLLIGPRGVNHGVELNEQVLEYARAKLCEFMQRSDAVHEMELCVPRFVAGNALLVEPGRTYSRIYCGAEVSVEDGMYFKQMLNVGGILIMPFLDELVKVTRTSTSQWSSEALLPVSFASLVKPAADADAQLVKLPIEFPSLCQLCRVCVRALVRDYVLDNVPKRTYRVGATRERNGHEQAKLNAMPADETSASAVDAAAPKAHGLNESNASSSRQACEAVGIPAHHLRFLRLMLSSSNESLERTTESGDRLEEQHASANALENPGFEPTDARSTSHTPGIYSPALQRQHNVTLASLDSGARSASEPSRAETPTHATNAAMLEENEFDDVSHYASPPRSRSSSHEHPFDTETSEKSQDSSGNDHAEDSAVQQDFFAELSTQPKFRMLMRDAIAQLTLPTSLKHYLMLESDSSAYLPLLRNSIQ